jgi:hypothetical protein
MRLRPLALLAPIAAAGLLSGCATKIDAGKAEDKIGGLVEERAGVAPKSVSCPGDKTAKKGDVFRCKVTMADGTIGQAVVTETDDKGRVNVDVRSFVNPIDPAKSKASIKQLVTEEIGSDVESVTCPPKIPSKKGTAYTCQVLGTDGSKGDVTVTIKDYLGNVHADAPFVHTHADAAAIEKDVKAKNDVKRFEVTCPEIVEGAKGTSFECQADSDRGKAVVTVTLTSETEEFDYKVRSAG